MDFLFSLVESSDWMLFSIAIAALAFGLYMAWTIGANDVANAMATSVGSRTLTFKQAVIIAGVMEFLGAVFAGGKVTSTIRKGIIDLSNVPPEMQQPELLMLGMLAALLAAALWLHGATLLGLPVSTTHSIVGAIVGFGLVVYGSSVVNWAKVASIVSSWVFSPLAGGILAFAIFRLIRSQILNASKPLRSLSRWAPLFASITIGIVVLSIFWKGLKNVFSAANQFGASDLDRFALMVGVLSAISICVPFYFLFRRFRFFGISSMMSHAGITALLGLVLIRGLWILTMVLVSGPPAITTDEVLDHRELTREIFNNENEYSRVILESYDLQDIPVMRQQFLAILSEDSLRNQILELIYPMVQDNSPHERFLADNRNASSEDLNGLLPAVEETDASISDETESRETVLQQIGTFAAREAQIEQSSSSVLPMLLTGINNTIETVSFYTITDSQEGYYRSDTSLRYRSQQKNRNTLQRPFDGIFTYHPRSFALYVHDNVNQLAAVFSIIAAILAYIVMFLSIRKHSDADRRNPIKRIERVFMILQVLTASYVAFAHGANDVANAVGPVAAVIDSVQRIAAHQGISRSVEVPVWILVMGGIGIVFGLATYGYKVMKTVGHDITELTPSRGFSAEFAAASVVLLASKLGIPISTTHTLVGGVLGVGMAQGIGSLNLKVIRSILSSWLLTLPIAGILAIGIFMILRLIFPF